MHGTKAGFLILPHVLPEIRDVDKRCALNGLVDCAFDGFARLVKPAQVRSEISEFLEIVDGIGPKVILEIGTASGRALFLLSHMASKDATSISVDLPGGRFGGG